VLGNSFVYHQFTSASEGWLIGQTLKAN